MAEDLEIREVSSVEEVTAMADLFDRIWGDERAVTPALLRALATHGDPVIAAYRGGDLIGGQVGFLGLEEGRPVLHSHITGVASGLEHRGVGLELKRAQRNWCLRGGVDVVTWTFDPMVARNAYFNLVKLGATADGFHRDFYGDMPDELNTGDRSDRLEARWEVRSERVERAMSGDRADGHEVEIPSLVETKDGVPTAVPGIPDSPSLLLPVPSDYHTLRRRDPAAGAAWRDAVGDALEASFDSGYHATGFIRDHGYVLERR